MNDWDTPLPYLPPLEIRLHIAEQDVDAFRSFIMADPEFRDFLISHPRTYESLVDRHTIRREVKDRITGRVIKYEYRFFGQLHRTRDRPAVEYTSGRQEWYRHGRRHRENDQPAVIDGQDREWWVNDRRHRDDRQPAVIHAGRREYWVNGVDVTPRAITPHMSINRRQGIALR